MGRAQGEEVGGGVNVFDEMGNAGCRKAHDSARLQLSISPYGAKTLVGLTDARRELAYTLLTIEL